MLAKELKNVLDALRPEQIERLWIHVKLGDEETIEVLEDELVITLEFVDTGMGDDPPTFGSIV